MENIKNERLERIKSHLSKFVCSKILAKAKIQKIKGSKQTLPHYLIEWWDDEEGYQSLSIPLKWR
jgi:hypothetical protein